MPYSSKAQARYFHAKEEAGEMPKKTVDDFDRASKGKMGGLPEHVQQKADGGMACMHCGGDVSPEGHAVGHEVAADMDDMRDGPGADGHGVEIKHEMPEPRGVSNLAKNHVQQQNPDLEVLERRKSFMHALKQKRK